MRNSVLNKLRIDKNCEGFDYFDFGCDYLTLSYVNPIDSLDDILFGLDIDNSNFGISTFLGKDFTYTKLSTNLGYALNYTYSYNGVSIPVMQYVRFNQHTKHITGKSAKISVYGSYFRLDDIGEFTDNFLINVIKKLSSEDPHIMRYDLRFDYFSLHKDVKVPDVNEICGYIHKQSFIKKWYSSDSLIDWSLGNTDTGRYKVRYYDKKIDTNKKNKWVLYSDFMKYKSVHRLEIEFLRAFTKSYTLSQINELEKKIWSVLGLENKQWDGSLFYRYDSSKEITSENRGKFFERYINLTRKLIKAGYNPYNLIEEAIVGEYGKDKALGILEQFINNSSVYEIH